MKRIVIPVKGNSKRLPRKNLLKIGDWCVFQYVVNAALGTEANQIIVSTDSDEVESVAQSMKKFEAERLLVHRRVTPEELDPETSVVNIAKSALLAQAEPSWIPSAKDDYTAIVLANCPEIRAEEIDIALNMLNDFDEVRSFRSLQGASITENGIWALKTTRLFQNPYGHLSVYLGGILTWATEIHTQQDFDWVVNVMTKKKRVHWET